MPDDLPLRLPERSSWISTCSVNVFTLPVFVRSFTNKALPLNICFRPSREKVIVAFLFGAWPSSLFASALTLCHCRHLRSRQKKKIVRSGNLQEATLLSIVGDQESRAS